MPEPSMLECAVRCQYIGSNVALYDWSFINWLPHRALERLSR